MAKKTDQPRLFQDDLYRLMALGDEIKEFYPNPQRLVNECFRRFPEAVINSDQHVLFRKAAASAFGMTYCPPDCRDDHKLL